MRHHCRDESSHRRGAHAGADPPRRRPPGLADHPGQCLGTAAGAGGHGGDRPLRQRGRPRRAGAGRAAGQPGVLELRLPAHGHHRLRRPGGGRRRRGGRACGAGAPAADRGAAGRGPGRAAVAAGGGVLRTDGRQRGGVGHLARLFRRTGLGGTGGAGAVRAVRRAGGAGTQPQPAAGAAAAQRPERRARRAAGRGAGPGRARDRPGHGDRRVEHLPVRRRLAVATAAGAPPRRGPVPAVAADPRAGGGARHPGRQRRHPGAHPVPAGGLRLVRAAGRGLRRRDPGGQPRTAAAGLLQRLLPRRLRLRGRGAGRARGGRARRRAPACRGAGDQRAGGGHRGAAGRGPVAGGRHGGRLAGRAAGGDRPCDRLPALDRAVRAAVGGRIPAGRGVHRRHSHPADAQRQRALAGGVPGLRRAVGRRLRQPRAVGGVRGVRRGPCPGPAAVLPATAGRGPPPCPRRPRTVHVFPATMGKHPATAGP